MLAGFDRGTAVLSGAGDPVRVETGVITGDLWATWQVPMAMGRGFRSAEDQPGGPRVVILAYGFWQYTPEVAFVNTSANNFISERVPDFHGWSDSGPDFDDYPVPVPLGNAAANPTPAIQVPTAPVYNQAPFSSGDNNPDAP